MAGERMRFSSPPAAVVVAFFWAFAEATFFFVLPDFFLLPASLRAPRLWKSMVAACLAGSLAGSVVLYALAVTWPSPVLSLLTTVSLVPADKLSEAGRMLDSLGLNAFLIQPYSLIPLKCFVFQIAHGSLPLPVVLAYILTGRASRNIAVAGLAAVAGLKFRSLVEKRWQVLLAVYVVAAGALVLAVI